MFYVKVKKTKNKKYKTKNKTKQQRRNLLQAIQYVNLPKLNYFVLCHIQHPSFCPLHCLKEEDHSSISDDILQRGIDVGVATILCTSDRKVLLTRRAAHLRTFPGIWVPPGGHVESGETVS